MPHAPLRPLLQGLLLGAAVLVLAWAPGRMPAPAASPVADAAAGAEGGAAAPGTPPVVPQFGSESPSADVRQVADWAFRSGDRGSRAVVVVDKQEARVYAFDRAGRLLGATPALLGSARGDHTVPGIGDKPIAQVLPAERTTPAGRFVAEPGVNAGGEDVVWVDYDAAVSMHRVRPTVQAERRLQRLASPTPRDNRISYGCINLPVAFYENVLSPLVRGSGAVVYVLPETQTAAAWFRLPGTAAAATLAGGDAPRPAAPAGPVRHGLRPGDDVATVASH